jgi:uncharacterized repeat protein (TIGR03803 family)
MKQPIGKLFVVLTVLAGTADFTALPANGGQIFGYVADGYGNPVDGVNVYASDGLGDNYSTTTGGNGYYSMVVVDNTYDVTMDCGQLDSMNYQCPGTNSVSVSDDSVEADFMLQFTTTPTYPLTALYDFSATTTNAIDILTNSDGAYPYCGLVLSGNSLYGTASSGGTNGAGTVFAVNTNLTGFAAVHIFAAPAGNSLGIATNSDGGGAGRGPGIIRRHSLRHGRGWRHKRQRDGVCRRHQWIGF